MEDTGVTRRTQENPGGPRGTYTKSLEDPARPTRTNEDPGGPRKTQEDPARHLQLLAHPAGFQIFSFRILYDFRVSLDDSEIFRTPLSLGLALSFSSLSIFAHLFH